MAASILAEAAHCILGSLTRQLRIDPSTIRDESGELAHLEEEIEIIQDALDEYGRIKQLDERRVEDTEKMVEDIQRVAPKLRKRASDHRSNLGDDLPPDIHDIAFWTYTFLDYMGKVLLDSISDWPDKPVENAWGDPKLHRLADKIEKAIQVAN